MGASGPPSSEDVGVSSLGCLLWALGAWGDSRSSAATHWLGGAVIVWESQPMMTEPPRGGLRFPATSACSSQAIQGRGHCAAAMWAARATPPHHVQCKWALGSSFQSAADWGQALPSGHFRAARAGPLWVVPGRTGRHSLGQQLLPCLSPCSHTKAWWPRDMTCSWQGPQEPSRARQPP